jgi:hypothetical protein
MMSFEGIASHHRFDLVSTIALLVGVTRRKQSWVSYRKPSLKQSAISLKVKLTKLSDGV